MNILQDKPTITEDQLDQLLDEVNKAGDLALDEAKKIAESSNEDIDTVKAEFDNENGSILPLYAERNTIDLSKLENIDKSLDELIENNLSDSISSELNLSDEDAIKFAKVLTRVKNNEKFNVYKELPRQIQEMVLKMLDITNSIDEMKNIKALNHATKILIDQLIADSEMDQLCIEIDKVFDELELPSFTDLYNDIVDESINVDFEKAKEQHPESAELIDKMTNGYKAACNFTLMEEALETNINKIRKAENSFKILNNKYRKSANESKYKLFDMEDIRNDLIRFGYSKETATRLLVAFLITYDGTDPNDLFMNTYTFFFENNMKSLYTIGKNATKTGVKLIENTNNFVEKMNKLVNERIEELGSHKK